MKLEDDAYYELELGASTILSDGAGNSVFLSSVDLRKKSKKRLFGKYINLADLPNNGHIPLDKQRAER